MKALIIQTAFIGDVILSLPLIEHLKNISQIESISYLARPDGYNVLETNPNLNEIIIYDKKGKDKGLLRLCQIIKKVKQGKYDIAYIPHRSLRSAIIPLFAGIKKRIGFDKSYISFLYTKKIKYKSNSHEIERNLSLLSLNNEKFKNIQLKIYFNESDFQKVENFLKKHNIKNGEKIVGIAPGSRWATKRWLKERYAELINLLKEEKNTRTMIFGSESEIALCEEINALSKNSGINTVGIFTPRESALAMGKTSVTVTNDSGATHLAVAGNTKVITIYGATVPAFGFYPYGNGHIIIEKDLPCRPCGIHGGDRCPLEHFKCMKDITAEEVFKKVSLYI